MLLVEMDINGTTSYLSREGQALEKYWDAKILSFDAPQYNISKKYGGYVKPTFGSISFIQDLFENDWVPPTSGLITLHYNPDDGTETTESSTTLFNGTAHLRSINRTQIKYDLHGEINTGSTIGKGTIHNNASLSDVFISCATTLGLSLDTSLARSEDSSVTHTLSSEKEMMSFLSDISASLSHLFYIEQGTIHLVDMFQDNGTTTITEFDYFPSTYELNPPTIITYSGVSQSGITYPYGKELSVNMYTSSETATSIALNNIWETYHKPYFNLRIPFIEPLPTTPGMRVQWTDTSNTEDVSAYMRIRNFRYDYNNEEVILVGEGEIEAV